MIQKRLIFSLLLIAFVFVLFACDRVTTLTTTNAITTTTSTTAISSDTTALTTLTTTLPASTTEATTVATTAATIVATTEDATTVSTEDAVQTLLVNAANAILITDSDNLTTSFVLPAERGDATISWASNNSEYIYIADTVTLITDEETEISYFVYQATVKQPSETVGTVTVVLTGTFSYGESTYEKQFICRVRAEYGLTTYSTLSDLHESAVLNDLITASGFVYSKYAGLTDAGYFIMDASGAFLNVYTTAENVALVNVGDEVRVKGKYFFYHTLFQVTELTEQVILNSNNSIELNKIVLTDASDLMLIDKTDKLLNGQIYTITVTPTILMQAAFPTIYLFDGSTRVATVYYNSLSESKLALAEYVGQKVTIDVLFYTYYESGSSILNTEIPEFWVTFDGGTDDIVAETMSDAEKLAMATGQIPASYDVTNALTLPTLVYGEYTEVIISPEISDYLSYASDTFTVVRPETDTAGTITVTIAYNDESETLVIDVLMKAVVVVIPGDDIFISEYFEGSSYSKFIEIYNGLAVTVNLSEYTLELYSNGATVASATMSLSGMLTPGSVLVVYNNRSTPILYIGDIVNNTVMNYNGDDAVVLKHNGEIVDSIGKVGERPTIEYWGTETLKTQNMTLVRMPSITGGDINPYDEYDPSSQWIAYPQDTVTNLGSHTVD